MLWVKGQFKHIPRCQPKRWLTTAGLSASKPRHLNRHQEDPHKLTLMVMAVRC